MQRLIIVYNPRSAKSKLVEEQVIAPARKLVSFMVGKYEVKPTNVSDNAIKLAKLLRNGDLVVAAGGDGTATIGLNGCMLSKKDVSFGVLGYGNFNDMARMLGTKNLRDVIDGKTQKIWPLEARVNGKLWRYAACYVTAGMFAESTEIFDRKKVRGELKHDKGLVYSVKQLASWYFKHRRKPFLAEFTLNGVPKPDATDYLAVNGRTVARLMRGGKHQRNKTIFLSSVNNLRGLPGLSWFMIRSILKRIPGVETKYDEIEFKNSSPVEIQAEGEYQKFKAVKTIEIKKSERALKVVVAA